VAGKETVSPSQLEDNEDSTASTSGYLSKKTDSLDDAEGRVSIAKGILNKPKPLKKGYYYILCFFPPRVNNLHFRFEENPSY
jgi:hypothetical protein